MTELRKTIRLFGAYGILIALILIAAWISGGFRWAGFFFIGLVLIFVAVYIWVRLRDRNRKIHLHHIAYSEETASNVPPGGIMLDNRNSARNDWREYWPIRQFLMSRALKKGEYYGFLSPRFFAKTALTYQDVKQFLKKTSFSADVYIFSPQPDWAAFFLNPFEQGDFVDPGFLNATQKFLAAIQYPDDILRKPMDSRHIVFSNYIVAQPDFWKRWLEINEKLYALCEKNGGDAVLRDILTAETAYTGAVERKVFIMERIASLIISNESRWTTIAYNPFMLAWSASSMRHHTVEAVACDALKLAMQERGYEVYRDAFEKMRQPILHELTNPAR